MEDAVPALGWLERIAAALGSGGLTRSGRLDRAQTLAAMDLFAGVEAEVLEELGQHFTPVTAGRGHFLCAEGEPGNEMYVMATGALDVLVQTHSGRVERVAELGPGTAVGMCSLMEEQHPRMASVVVKEAMTGLAMDRITWAAASHRFDPVGSALRVAMIRALGRQLAVANAELTMHDLESKRQIARMRAGASLETYGAQEAEDDLPAYLTEGG